jgi:hypothetical protein
VVTTRGAVAVRGRGDPASAAARGAVASRRRAVLGIAVGLLTVPAIAAAQGAGAGVRVGFLEAGSASANRHFLDAFRTGLRGRGYEEGRNLVLDVREGARVRTAALAAAARRRGYPVMDRRRLVLAARVRGDPVTVALARLGRVPLRDVVGQEGRMRRFRAVVAATLAPSFARNACARAGESVD